MAAAKITQVEFALNGVIPVHAVVAKATQSDWIVVSPGMYPICAVDIDGVAETMTRPTLTVNNTGTAYTATDVTIAYDGATALTRPASNFYVRTTSGEIIYVTADDGYDGTSGNLTARRGCLGTTASATGLADGNTLYLMCGVVLGDATTGSVDVVYIPMPEDPATGLE